MSLEEKLRHTPITPLREDERKTKLADIATSISFSLTIGTALDFYSGLRTLGEVALSRALNGTFAVATSTLYGDWKDYLYRKTKTTEYHSLLRRKTVDWLAFATFGAPTYLPFVGGVKFISLYLSRGKIDGVTVQQTLDVIWNATKTIYAVSPFTGILYGWYNDVVRKLFGAKTSGEKSEQYITTHHTPQQKDALPQKDNYQTPADSTP